MATIDRPPQTGGKGLYLKQQLKDKLIEHKQCIDKHGQDLPEIRNWKWSRDVERKGDGGKGVCVNYTDDVSARANMKYKTSHLNLGAVVSVRGSVVDVRFDAQLPSIYSLLHAKEGEIAIEVLAQLDAHRVRGIALTPTEGLARGMVVEDTGGPLQAPVGKEVLSRMFDVFGNAIDRQPPPTNVQWRAVHRAPPSLARPR